MQAIHHLNRPALKAPPRFGSRFDFQVRHSSWKNIKKTTKDYRIFIFKAISESKIKIYIF
jgi:hypothetical protein